MKRARLLNCCRSWLFLASVAASSSQAASQAPSIDPKGLQAPAGSFRASQELDLSMHSEFVSKPVGQRGRWQADRGYFGNDDPGTYQFDDARTDDYSGIRLRRPRRY